MIKLKSDLIMERKPRGRRLPWSMLPPLVAVLLTVLTVLAGLTLERWWAKLASSAWKSRMSAKGEIFDPRRIWPPPSVRSLQFSNEFARVTVELPWGLRMYGGQYCSVVREAPGMARRGSQEPKPPSYGNQNSTNTWQDLKARLAGARYRSRHSGN